jgi:hypothetical protein
MRTVTLKFETDFVDKTTGKETVVRKLSGKLMRVIQRELVTNCNINEM